jgi:hypothetical protein
VLVSALINRAIRHRYDFMVSFLSIPMIFPAMAGWPWTVILAKSESVPNGGLGRLVATPQSALVRHNRQNRD